MVQAEPGTGLSEQAFWRAESAGRFAFIVDAADYFNIVRAAMLKAEHSIMLIAWDYDARIRLGDDPSEGPEKLGDFLLWLANRRPGLQIRLLRWDTGAFRALFRGTALWTVLRWRAHPRITLRLDGAHPWASSHHQKIVVIDDAIAFCGGIDMTIDRWDTREHRDADPRRVGPGGRPHAPWHDATAAFDGPAARAMGDLARARWRTACGEVLPAADADHDCWPEGLVPGFRDAPLAIARTLPAMRDMVPVHEVEAAYVDLIHRARRVIYAESQYFASRRIARAMAERLIEEDGPEIVIINPQGAQGWLEPLAMDTARARLVDALQRIDRHGRFRIYYPQTRQGAPIYVHAKLMVIDDCFLRVGSSNFNNRSLRLDTECDVILSAETRPDLRPGITALRDDLLAEHLGVTAGAVSAAVAEKGSLIGAIEALRGAGRSLVPYQRPELNGFQAWLADNEILDPNGPEEIFEPLHRRGLFKGWGRIMRRLRRQNNR